MEGIKILISNRLGRWSMACAVECWIGRIVYAFGEKVCRALKWKHQLILKRLLNLWWPEYMRVMGQLTCADQAIKQWLSTYETLSKYRNELVPNQSNTSHYMQLPFLAVGFAFFSLSCKARIVPCSNATATLFQMLLWLALLNLREQCKVSTNLTVTLFRCEWHETQSCCQYHWGYLSSKNSPGFCGYNLVHPLIILQTRWQLCIKTQRRSWITANLSCYSIATTEQNSRTTMSKLMRVLTQFT